MDVDPETGSVDGTRRVSRSPADARPACERCHKQKGKCHFLQGQSTCSGCSRLGLACQPRRRKRMGRRPILKSFLSGTTSIVSLSSEPSQSYEESTDLNDAASSSARAQAIIKTAPSSPVQARLNSSPTFEHGKRQFSLNLHSLKSPTCTYPLVDNVLLTREGFFETHRHFMLGPTFADSYHHTVLRLYHRSPRLIADAYLAVLHRMYTQRKLIAHPDREDLTIAAQCLRSLRHVSSRVLISHVEDAAAVVMLGQILLVYNSMTPCTSTRVITRAALLSVRDWFPALSQRPDLYGITLVTVLVDTIDSLVRREMPIVRVSACATDTVDRSVGICWSLLPLLYDLCERSFQVKTAAARERTWTSGDQDPYADIEQAILSWAPSLSPQFYSRYSASEVAIMQSQARLYRLAALLLIHRLRYPLGTEDSTACAYAKNILTEMSPLVSWPVNGATGWCIDFPLFLAMLEIPEQGEDVFRSLESKRFRQPHPEIELRFVKYIRKAREAGYSGLWFDLVNEGLDGDILP
ncbi:uncharacterized protein E0L32_009870 [Thyridium curvatum]|uniref:Zn(2)-C6 fungal-type domain-containing protein n=1 Tax=Thyridium curvatum TaxID=1093900 RepID=A0A507AUV3_9PEZI|nr:uncharacterized protein E0L32_009870 [Thyridium curvatum]TPX08681.1 hypothetical protein E0L32_009870 [Thyridium curvatum]